jgi:2-polyprenyl-3-methyl-5-hydroxy-6-metoxy-1,4-benzoquinol methylase
MQKKTVRPVQYIHRKTCALDDGPAEGCSPHWEMRVRVPDHESHLGEFDVVYCRKCQMGFTDPYPTEETSGFLYEEKSSADFDRIQESVVDRFKDLPARNIFRRLFPERNLSSIRRVLDFGCGNARFAASARDVFSAAEVHAVDFQPEPPPQLKTGHAARLEYKTVHQFDASDCAYDLIILRHVLEHSHHPVSLIRKLAARLQPDGVLYIEVPNLDSGCGRLFGKYWKGFYVPRHIFHFTPASLTRVLAMAGLEGKVGKSEPPHMGNMIAILGGLKKTSVWVQLLGGLLHPVQLVTEAFHRSSSCIRFRAVKSAATGSPPAT